MESTMINPKRIVAIARKWQKLAAIISRKRISTSRADVTTDWEAKKSIAIKGHFIIYTADGRRFVIPLAYHSNPIFQELFKMSEDEYGLPCNGPITMPCDAVFMDYIVSFLRRPMPKDVEIALLMSMATDRCSTSSCLHQLHTNQSIFVHGY